MYTKIALKKNLHHMTIPANPNLMARTTQSIRPSPNGFSQFTYLFEFTHFCRIRIQKKKLNVRTNVDKHAKATLRRQVTSLKSHIVNIIYRPMTSNIAIWFCFCSDVTGWNVWLVWPIKCNIRYLDINT